MQKLFILFVMLTDIAISQSAPIRHIKEIAASIGICNNDLEYYGKHKAKLPLTLINEEKSEGVYEVEFNTTTLNNQISSGIYFYQLNAGNYFYSR